MGLKPFTVKQIEYQWSRLEHWLSMSEWSPGEAAYLSVGLDPELTDGPNPQQGLGAFWLPNSRPSEFDDQRSLEEYAISRLRRSQEITSEASKATVRTPHQWLAWSVDVSNEPPWLKGAYGKKSIVELLPELDAYKDIPSGRSMTSREAGRMGGERKRDKSKKEQTKRSLKPQIQEWLANGCPTSQRELADDLYERVLQKYPEKTDPYYVEHSTICTLIRNMKKDANSKS